MVATLVYTRRNQRQSRLVYLIIDRMYIKIELCGYIMFVDDYNTELRVCTCSRLITELQLANYSIYTLEDYVVILNK
jgi:hypothetical protein